MREGIADSRPSNILLQASWQLSLQYASHVAWSVTCFEFWLFHDVSHGCPECGWSACMAAAQ